MKGMGLIITPVSVRYVSLRPSRLVWAYRTPWTHTVAILQTVLLEGR